MDTSRIWLIADGRQDALVRVRELLEERGAAVELLDLSDAFERIVRNQGEALLDNLRGLLTRVRQQADAFATADLDPEPSDGGASPEGDPPKPAPDASQPQDEEKDLDQRLGAALRRGRPDVIVVTSPRYLRGLDLLTRFSGGNALRVGLLTDYNLSGAWLKAALNAYIIPDARLRRPLVDEGIDVSRLLVAGPPVPRAYETAPDADALRASFGLAEPEAGTTVMVFCDEFDSAQLDKLVFQMSLVERPMTPIFYTGDDPSRAEALRRAAQRHGLLARRLGAVPNLQDFIAAAHLVVAPPTSQRIVHILALDRPLLLAGSAGDVANQTDFLLDQGCAWHTADILRLGADLEVALGAERLGALTEAAGHVGRVTGSVEVAD
ncbi:MAG: hypothetical protein AAFS10_27605, partial [Myxococcota bacterium]